MANSDKNIVITPNIGQTAKPKIEVTGANDATKSIEINDDGSLTFNSTLAATSGAIANGNANLVTGDAVYDYIQSQGFSSGDISEIVAGTGLSGGATSGTATLNIDSTVTTLTGSQTLTNKTLTSPNLTGLIATTLTAGSEQITITDESDDTLVEVIQTGTGHRFLVDSDSGSGNTSFRIRSDGKVMIGLAENVTGGAWFYNKYDTSAQSFKSNMPGSVGSAAFTKLADTNTGIYFPADDTLGLTTGGVERLRLSSSGVQFNGAFTFPTADGSANQILKTNGSGSVTWGDITHPNIAAANSSYNSGRTYIQDVVVDSNGHIVGLSHVTDTLLDEDNMASNSDTAAATQQSIKAYVDSQTSANTVTVTDSTANTNFPVVFHNESNGLLDDTGALRYNPSTGTLLVPNLTVAGTTTQVDTVTMNAANAVVFEGATADAHETTLSIVDPTADHTQYLINQGGYIPVLAVATTTAITSTPAELNVLDGYTGSVTELNYLNTLHATGVTATEFDYLDGVTSNIQTQLNAKGTGDMTEVIAGTGLSGGATSGSATLSIDSTVATLTGTQTFTNKTLTSPTLTTPDLGTPTALVLTNATGFPTLNQNTTGSAATLTSGRTIAMTGDVVWNSGAFNGGGNVTGAATIQVDAVDIPMLSATGTASSSTFLRGDNTWGAPSYTTALAWGAITSKPSTFAPILGTTSSTALAGDTTTITSGQASAITANTAKVSNATHTGDVTGSTALTIASGAVDIAMLSATGTASSSTYLRGDNTWATVSSGGDSNAGGVNGSASAPTFSFTSDTNTGFYRPAADEISITTGGSRRLTFNEDTILPHWADHYSVGTSSRKFNNGYFNLLDTENIKINGAQGSDGQVLTSTGSGVAWESAGGGMSSFTLTGDSGTNQSVADGNTVDIAGGTGISTVVGATDTVTVAIDSTVATLTGTQTLTNKTLDAPTITGTLDETGDIEISSLYGRLNFKKDSNGNVNNDAIFFINGTDQYAGAIKYFHSGNELRFDANQATQLHITDGAIYAPVDNDVDLGTASLKFKNSYFGLVDAENFKINGGQGSDGQVLTSTGSGVAWEDAGGGGASTIGALTDVTIDATNFTDSILIQTNSDGSAPTTGTLNGSTRNIGLGVDVFKTLTSGSYNVVLGWTAGDSITSGNQNILIGGRTGTSVGTTSGIVAIGHDAARDRHTGDNGVYIGTQAGAYASSNASGTVAIGCGAGKYGMDGSGCIAIGYSTMEGAAATGSGNQGQHNIAMGNNTMKNVSTGENNIMLGSDSGYYLTTGSRNIGIGRQAADGFDTESDNIAIGYAALGGAVAGGEKNVAIGNYAADALTSGDKNVIVGHSAATAVTAMTNSVVMGFEAMEATTGGGGGNESVVIGSMAHKDDAAGSANVSLGYMAARYATSGSMNVAIGHQAHLNSTAGNANTFVGTGAGKGQSSTTGGSYNVAIGESALRDHTTGGFNIAVGRDSATNITTGQGNVVIGRNTSTLTATSDSQLMIGSGLSTSCVWLTGTSDGSVNLPAAILKIAGSVGTDGQVLTSTGSAVAWEDAAGGGTTGYTWTDTAGSEQFLISDTSDTALFKVQNAGTGNAFEVHDQASDTSAFVVKNDGKVGILKNPSSSLTYDVEIGGETLSERFTSSVTGSASSPAFRFSGDSNTGMYNGGTDILGFSTDSTSRMTIAADGTVDVVGTLDTTNLTIGGAQGSDGQVLTSTGSGVAWEDAAGGGGASAIDGLSDATLGSNSVWLGSTPSSTTSYNASLGVGALDALNGTLGTKNVAVGYNAGTANTEGFKNVFVGYAAGSANTDADYNTFVGSQAGTANTTGLRNLAIGANALDAADTESDNIAIGYSALGGAVAGGEKNLAIGNYAGDAVTSADGSVLLGHNAGTAITTGGYNVAIGYEAGTQFSTGNSNIAIGRWAHLYGNGSSNIALGFMSMADADITGSNNIAIGDYAIQTNVTGSHNIGIGYGSGDNLTSANKNIIIGYEAGDNITTGDNNVMIGGADAASATGSDQLSISSGDGGVTWITGTSAGAVNLPNSILTLNGSVGSDGQVLTSTGSAVAWETPSGGGGGASAIGGLDDVLMDATNFVDSLLIQTNSDGSAPSTGTLNSASNNIGIGKDVFSALTSGDTNVGIGTWALKLVADGSNNTAIGAYAGRDIADGVGNIAIGASSGYGITSGDYNVIMGYNAASAAMTGSNNIGLGYTALNANTSGTRNIAIGAGSLDAADTESDNIAIGYDALGGAVAGGEKNVAIGNYAGDAITQGDENTLLGHEAGTTLTTAKYSVAVGYRSLKNTDTGDRNTAVGYLSMEGAANNSADQNAAFGGYTLKNVQDGATGNTGLGYLSLSAVTTGDKNIAIGYESGDNITTGSNNVVIGAADVSSATGSDQLSISSGDGSPVWITGTSAGAVNLPNSILTLNGSVGSDGQVLTSTGSAVAWETPSGGGGASEIDDLSDGKTSDNFSIGLGLNALYSITDGQGHQNIAFGVNAGYAVTVADNNTLIGARAGSTLDSNENTAVGYQALRYGTGASNTTVGAYAGEGTSGSATGASNTMVGYKAGFAYTTAAGNVLVGSEAGTAITTGGDNVMVGYRAGKATTTGTMNTMIGYDAGVATNSYYNTIIGYKAGDSVSGSDHSNTLIGTEAMGGMSASDVVAVGKWTILENTADGTVAVGTEAGRKHESGTGATYIGYKAGWANTTGSRNIAIGYRAYDNADTESDNIAIGYDALGGAVAGATTTIAIGNYSLDAVTSGFGITAVGHKAGTALTTGWGSTMLGFEAGSETTGSRNTLIGYRAGYYYTSGNDNIALGYQALAGSYGNSTGSNNIALGKSSGCNITTGSKNIAIGDAAGNNITTGDFNVVIGAADVASATGDSQLSISSGDGSTVWILGNSSGSCFQGDDAATWSTTSDRRVKKNIIPYAKGLAEIKQLEPKSFQYIEDNPMKLDAEKQRHNFVAQEIESVFPDMVKESEHEIDGEKVKTINTDEVLLALVNAVKELSEEIDSLKK